MAGDVGHGVIPALARQVNVRWAPAALADLQRFSSFLNDRHPDLARSVAHEIAGRIEVLADFPKLGRPLGDRDDLRQLVLKVLNADYVFQYSVDDEQVLILRVFHGREDRERG